MISEIKQILTVEGKDNVHPWRRLALIALVLLALAVGTLITVRSLAAPFQVDGRPVEQLTRVQQAENERYTALAEYYKTIDEARQRAIFADAARWNAQAEYYQRSSAQQRAIEADKARWEGLANYYLAQEGANQRAWDAYAARLTALAQYYEANGK